MRKLATGLCFAWLLLGGVFVDAGPAQAQVTKMTDITFSLDFIVLGRHAPFYVAIEKGFFKEENLNVNIIPAKGTAQAFRMSKPDSRRSGLSTWRAMWSRAPRAATVKVVSVIYQKAPFCFFSLDPGANVTQPEEFRGAAGRIEHRQLHLEHRQGDDAQGRSRPGQAQRLQASSRRRASQCSPPARSRRSTSSS